MNIFFKKRKYKIPSLHPEIKEKRKQNKKRKLKDITIRVNLESEGCNGPGSQV